MSGYLSSIWVRESGDLWTRATKPAMYDALADGNLPPVCFTQWLFDRASIADAMVSACNRVNDLLGPTAELPLLAIAMEERGFTAGYSEAHGLDLTSNNRLSHEARDLINMINAETTVPHETSSALAAPYSRHLAGTFSLQARPERSHPPFHNGIAVTALWGYFKCSWISASTSTRTRRRVPAGTNPTHHEFVTYFCRMSSLSKLVKTEDIIQALLTTPSGGVFDALRAGYTFRKVLSHVIGTTNRSVRLNDGHNSAIVTSAPSCTRCGRSGHVQENCTFYTFI
jgi:hypothetical protein